MNEQFQGLPIVPGTNIKDLKTHEPENLKMVCHVIVLHERILSVFFIIQTTLLNYEQMISAGGRDRRPGHLRFQDIRTRWEDVPGALGETAHGIFPMVLLLLENGSPLHCREEETRFYGAEPFLY